MTINLLIMLMKTCRLQLVQREAFRNLKVEAMMSALAIIEF